MWASSSCKCTQRRRQRWRRWRRLRLSRRRRRRRRLRRWRRHICERRRRRSDGKAEQWATFAYLLTTSSLVTFMAKWHTPLMLTWVYYCTKDLVWMLKKSKKVTKCTWVKRLGRKSVKAAKKAKKRTMHRSYSDVMLPRGSRKEWRQRFSFRQKSLKSDGQVSPIF